MGSLEPRPGRLFPQGHVRAVGVAEDVDVEPARRGPRLQRTGHGGQPGFQHPGILVVDGNEERRPRLGRTRTRLPLPGGQRPRVTPGHRGGGHPPPSAPVAAKGQGIQARDPQAEPRHRGPEGGDDPREGGCKEGKDGELQRGEPSRPHDPHHHPDTGARGRRHQAGERRAADLQSRDPDPVRVSVHPPTPTGSSRSPRGRGRPA